MTANALGVVERMGNAAPLAAPPNILYLHSHDTGRYIQPYGFAVPTPNLQRFAEDAVVFRRAFCANPTCSASRASLLTGQYPHTNGMVGLAHRGFSLNEPEHHAVRILKRAGYTTALSGVQHEAHNRPENPAWQQLGYDRNLNENREDIAPAAARFLEDAPRQPFFLSVGFAQTHRDFPDVPTGPESNFLMPPPCFPDNDATRRDFAGYSRLAKKLDDQVGVVLDALDRSGLAENTLVISTTDHGIAFPGMKCNLTDHGIGVLLMMRGPGGFKGGRVCDALVSHVDLLPTILELAGAEAPQRLDGTSLMPLVRGEMDAVREAVFSEVNYHAAYEPMRGVRTDRYNYIRRFGERRKVVPSNCDDSITKTLWVDNGWLEAEHPEEVLYDTLFDPQQVCNRVDDPACTAVLEEMRGRLDAWMEETDDPIRRGSIPRPEGAIVNAPESYSPRDRPEA